MNLIPKRQHSEPVADSNPWAVRRKKAKQPKYKDKELKRLLEFDDMFGLSRYNPGRGVNYGSAYVEEVDDTSSISSFSTNATMDNIPGTGRTIDMCFYQPVGRAIERIALKIAIRLNICHPSPAQIIRVLCLAPALGIFPGDAEKRPSDVIDDISAERPSAVPGILSLVQQSQ